VDHARPRVDPVLFCISFYYNLFKCIIFPFICFLFYFIFNLF
jgi:hypothetical protein